MDQLRQLCIDMRAEEAEKERLEEELKTVNIKLDTLRLKKIPELMESLEVKNATFAGLGRVQLAADIYASTVAGKKEDAMQWLRDCGYSDMITETYNASSLKALFRRQLKEGILPPDDIFTVTPFTRASIVKAAA
jgi:NAD-specific glutamate dehydrogenase